MAQQIPEYIDPYVMADRGAVLSGQYSPSELARLRESLADSGGKVEFQLGFQREGRVARINGDVKATLNIKCEVCLEPMIFHVAATSRLAVVSSLDEVNRLSEEYEPLLFQGERMSVRDIVEDEIILALPDYPRHEQCELGAQPADSGQEEIEPSDTVGDEKANPFGILTELIKKQE